MPARNPVTFSLICDRFPRLEYLFGVFLRRYWEAAQVAPEPVIRKFVRRNPAAANETMCQLAALREYLERAGQGEDAAIEFLEMVECPYYPPFYGSSALSWLKQVQAVLFHEQFGVPMGAPARSSEVPELSFYQALNFYEALDFPEWPLHFPLVLLGSYLPLGGYAALESFIGLGAVTTELAGHAGYLAEVITLSSYRTPLQEVRA